MTSLLLDQDNWDLCLDANGNIAVASSPYAVAQDVSCAIRLFLGECWYDTTRGIPYFGSILGQFPNPAFLKAQIEAAAEGVPGVQAAQCVFTSYSDRALGGAVMLTIDGSTVTLNFGGDSSGLVTSIGVA